MKRTLIVAILVNLFAPLSARAVMITGQQTAVNEWTYTLTFAPLDNYSIFQPTTTITLTGLFGVIDATGPTDTDFPPYIDEISRDWTAEVLNGGTEVRWTHIGPGTGNFGDERHIFGFQVYANGATGGLVSLATSGFSRDTNNALPDGTFNVDITGSVAGPVSAFAWHGPEPIFAGVSGNPSFVQGRPGTYGTKGNYELVVPLQSGGIGHFYRNNDEPNLPWNGPYPFATDQAVEAVSLIQSNLSSSGDPPGNLAVVARIGETLNYFLGEEGTSPWSGPTAITTGVTGIPSFVQARPGTFGSMGNYELVTPLVSGGMAHFYRDNDDPNMPWIRTDTFGAELGIVNAVSLIQSDRSTQFVQTGVQGAGNLALLARVAGGTNLLYFERDDVAPFAWHGPFTITTGVIGNPSFVLSNPGTYGNMGNYELVIPLLNGGIGRFERNNDDLSLPWIQTHTFGTTLGTVNGVSLIQSNFSTTGNGPGNLAVVSVANNHLDYFYRDDK
jgi:hypothetical protein